MTSEITHRLQIHLLKQKVTQIKGAHLSSKMDLRRKRVLRRYYPLKNNMIYSDRIDTFEADFYKPHCNAVLLTFIRRYDRARFTIGSISRKPANWLLVRRF